MTDMAEVASAEFRARDGSRLPASPEASRALGRALTDEHLLALLVRYGLPTRRDRGCLRVDVQALREALARALREEPAGVGAELRDLLAMVGGVLHRSAHDVAVPLPRADAQLRAVPAAGPPRDVLLGMEEVDAGRAGDLLRALDALMHELELPPDLLLRTLVPLLEHAEVAGLAARILGRAGVEEAAGPLERALSRSPSADDRLEMLAALMRLGHRALGLRTFRTILIHGSEEVRRQAVRDLGEVARPEDRDALHDMLRLSPRAARVALAAILYGVGDARGYAPLARELEQLHAESPAAHARAVLEAVATANTQRLLPLVDAYLERETRPWHRAHARRLIQRLGAQGAEERATEQLMHLAERSYFAGQREEALGWLDELLRHEPRHPHGLYLQANCLKEEGEPAEALRITGVALSAAPRNWRLHRLRGSLLWDNGRPEDAIGAYDRALALHPVDPYTWYYKGYVLYRLGRYEAALPCLNRALSLENDSPCIHNQKAFCLERLERYSEAVACYRRSLRLDPGELDTREYLGQALHASGQLEQALACFDRVLAAAPGREETLYRRADVLYDLERWEESAACFAHYLELQPGSYNGWFNRGLCLRFLGLYEEAAACFCEALTVRPSSTNAQRHLDYCRAR